MYILWDGIFTCHLGVLELESGGIIHLSESTSVMWLNK